MSGRAVISVSACWTHVKGGNDASCPVLPGDIHAEWLEKCVRHLRRSTQLPVVVTLTGFPGLCHVPPGRERDALWRTFVRSRFVSSPYDLPHQKGAAITIRQALEFARHMRYDYLIHTAEDVVPRHDSIPYMLERLDEGWDYVGEVWGENDDQLESRFFACRVNALLQNFNPLALLDVGGTPIERYLANILAMKRVCREKRQNGASYHHSHDPDEWRRLLKLEQ